jgi:hypothetical protein
MTIPVYLELGSKRTFASSADWPGWSRGGRDEASAMQALLDYGPRYGAAIRAARLGFEPPAGLTTFKVVERLQGDTTTDFGTPGRVPAGDTAAVRDEELRRLEKILKACWRTFDAAAESAKGKTFRTGPRGGGRDLEKIVRHVVDAQHAYVTKLGWKAPFWPSLGEAWEDVLKGFTASAHGALPTHGPRGGAYWPARYFVRRSAWHILDHAWEIEDRSSPGS